MQVVQPHDEPVRFFKMRFPVQPVQGQRQGARVITRLFGALQLLRAQFAQAVQAAIALVGEPVVELDADLQRLGTQQLVGSFSIVAQTVGQRQRAAALDQVESGLFAQLKEALAQRVARRVVVMLGPQQPRQPQAGGQPPTASQASKAASRGARRCVFPCAVSNCGSVDRRTRES